MLRWGLAFVFFYAAIFGLVSPHFWVDFFPGFLGSMISTRVLLPLFSVWQIVLAAWLFMGKKLELSALAAIITLALIVTANINVLDIVFPDVGLLFSALALYDLAKEKKNGIV